jgi:predicted transcriptional regulator
MAQDEEKVKGPDWSTIVSFATVATPVVIAVVKALSERRAQSLNRYQVAVAAGQPVAEVAPVLEEMAEHGVVVASGDPGSPNTREYQLRPQVT